MILVPTSLLTSIPAGQLEAILAHELAHVRRWDFVVNLLQSLIETLFFYQPPSGGCRIGFGRNAKTAVMILRSRSLAIESSMDGLCLRLRSFEVRRFHDLRSAFGTDPCWPCPSADDLLR